MKRKLLILFLCFVISFCAILKFPSIALANEVEDEYAIEPYFLVETLTASAFLEFLVGMGISIGFTGIAYEVVRTDEPITDFDDLYDRGVSPRVITSLKTKYEEMCQHFASGVDSAFNIGANWLKGINLSSLASALGFRVATEEITSTGDLNIGAIPGIAAAGRKYYVINSYKSASKGYAYEVFLFDSIGGYTNDYEFENGLLALSAYNLEKLTLSDLSKCTGANWIVRTGSNYISITNCPDVIKKFPKVLSADKMQASIDFIINNGLISDDYILNKENHVITGIDNSISVSTSIPSNGISVTNDAISSYPIPEAGSAELDEDGKIISGDLTSVIDAIKEYINNVTLTGDLVIDDVVDVPVDDSEDDTVAGDGDILVPELGEMGDYKVDLKDLFPFCLPFDLIDFINVLAQEPKAPYFEFELPLPADINNGSYTFVIDLSPFESVAKLLRNMETLAFIVGLILITRDKMIRG